MSSNALLMSKSARSEFSPSDVLLVRVGIPQPAVLTSLRLAARATDFTEMVNALGEICADPLLGESIRLASPVLAAQMRRLAAREILAPKKVTRIFLSIAKYALRTVSRPTPFGTFAGVALAEFGEDPAVEFGDAYRRAASVSPEWLSGYARRLIHQGDFDPSTHVVWNNLAVLRGGRFYLAVQPSSNDGDSDDVMPTVKSLKANLLIEMAAEESRYSLSLSDLVPRLCARFPSLPAFAVVQFCSNLIRESYLLTSATPDTCTARFSDHEALCKLGVPEEAASAVSRDLESYALAGASRLSSLDFAEQTLAAVHSPTRSAIQVDCVVDARVVLPRSVAEDAARAIEVALRTAVNPLLPLHLRGFHRDFIEKFGIGLGVPVLKVMDELAGVGIPPAYKNPEPGGPRMQAEGLDLDVRDRNARLISAVMPQISAGCDEVVLDEAVIRDLTSSVSPAAPEGSDISVELWSESTEDLRRGDYRLLAAPVGVFTAVGSVHGRFGHLFKGDDLWTKFENWINQSPIAREIQIQSPINVDRIMNVGRVSPARPSTIAVGTFPLPTERPGGLARVGVMAMHDRLIALDLDTGEPLRFVLGSMVDQSRFVPNAVRLLLEISGGMNRALLCWDWGALASSPYLPRVRLGSVIMARARWLVPDSLTSSVTEAEWMERFGAWSEKVKLPRHIQVKQLDLRLSLDTAEILDRKVLRNILQSGVDNLMIEEDGNGAERNFGWTHGRPTELVVSARRDVTPARTVKRAFTEADYQLPRHTLSASMWIYLKVYSATRDQNQILTAYVAPAINQHNEVISDWFYIRYVDPHAHLRIRVKVANEENKQSVLFSLLSALSKAEERYVHRTTIDVYEPEVYRYGGIDTIGLAEAAFKTDSLAALDQLKFIERDHLVKSCLFSGIQMADIAITAADPAALAKLSSIELKNSHVRKEVRSFYDRLQRSEAANLLPSHWLEDATSIDASWLARRHALGQLFERLTKPRRGGAPTSDVLFSVLHMSHNRLVGARNSEEDALGVCGYLVSKLKGQRWT